MAIRDSSSLEAVRLSCTLPYYWPCCVDHHLQTSGQGQGQGQQQRVVKQNRQPKAINTLSNNSRSQVIVGSETDSLPTLITADGHGGDEAVQAPIEETPEAAVDIIETFLQLPDVAGVAKVENEDEAADDVRWSCWNYAQVVADTLL